MQVLHEQEERLRVAFPQQQTLDGVERRLAAAPRIELPPHLVLHRHVEQGENGWEGLPNRLTKRQQPGGETLPQALAGVALVELVQADAASPATGEGSAPDMKASDKKSADRKSALREQALADAGVQTMLEIFPAEIRDVEEM